MTSILGISAFYHDSAATLIKDGKIIAAGQEERFSRKKHDARYPSHAVDYVLKEGKYKLQQESVAYMGCAAVHLSQLVKELTDEQKEEVPVDENLTKIFQDWDDG